MPRRIGVLIAALILTASSAFAQGVEVSASVGYGASEGVSTSRGPILGQAYDRLNVNSGGSFNFTVGVFLNERAEVEFLFGRQSSRLDAEGAAGTLQVSELNVNHYMGNFVYNWGTHGTRVRPYFFGGIGATQFSFGNNLLPGSSGSIPGDTQLSTNWGGGVKAMFSPNVGAKVGIRWTPTYMGSSTDGIWCDPFYGCWPIGQHHNVNQFETAGGVVIKFH
jgi:opacity protein-like surface antigen